MAKPGVQGLRGKSTGFFAGELQYNRGEVVCDYYGEDIPTKDDDKMCHTYRDYQTEKNVCFFLHK